MAFKIAMPNFYCTNINMIIFNFDFVSCYLAILIYRLLDILDEESAGFLKIGLCKKCTLQMLCFIVPNAQVRHCNVKESVQKQIRDECVHSHIILINYLNVKSTMHSQDKPHLVWCIII
jgi:hypothetical protein